MAKYEFKCINENCTEKEKIIEVSIPMSEYSEEKFPICEKCNEKTVRIYSTFAHQTFGDGYKS